MLPVIIPAYKAWSRIDSVTACVKDQGFTVECYIRDNSNDNIYYTRAINEGIRWYLSDEPKYMLILSDDVYLEGGCLKKLYDFAQDNPRVGIISPVQQNREGKIVWAASLNSWPHGIHVLNTPQEDPYPNNWPSGAVFMVRTEMLREIGLLDENMRFICSDADLGLTARARGWECWVVPQARVTHEFAGSMDTENKELARIKIEDLKYFTQKWLSGDLFRHLEHDGSRIGVTDPHHLLTRCEQALKELAAQP